MSDQFPPPAQPTPGAGPTGGQPGGQPGAQPGGQPGGTTPPPPTEGFGTPGGSSAPPPPPARKSRKKLIIGIIAAVVVLALVAGAAVVAVVALTGPDKHTLTITKTAGGMERDSAKETELKTQLDAAEQQFETQAKRVSYVRSGVYDQDDAKRGPEGALVFLGAKIDGQQDPAKFVSSFRKQAETNGFKTEKIAAGDGGGQAVCAYQGTGQKIAICAWATNDTMGELVPTVPGYDSKQLAELLLDVRSDVEKKD